MRKPIRDCRPLVKRCREKASRHSFIAEHIVAIISAQIRIMRESRGWTQEELGRRCGMRQQDIAWCENFDRDTYSLSTLRKLARAFDVSLVVRFAPFSELFDDFAYTSRDDLDIPSFEDEDAWTPQ